MRSSLLVLFIFFFLINCYNCFEQHKSYKVNITQTLRKPELRLLWQYPLVSSFRGEYNPYEGSIPVVSERYRQLFIGSSQGYLYSLFLNSGRLNWRFYTTAPIRTHPLLLEPQNLLLFGNESGNFYCLSINKSSYKKEWERGLGYEIRNKPEVYEDMVFVKNENEEIFALNIKDGSSIWSYIPKREAEIVSYGTSGLLLYKDYLITGYYGGLIRAFNKYNGEVVWEVNLSEGKGIPSYSSLTGKFTQPLFDVDATPLLVDKDTVWVASLEGGVFAIKILKGEILWWKEDIKRVTCMRQYKDLVYLSVAGYGIFILNQEGIVLWKRRLGTGLYSCPIFYKDIMFISNRYKELWILNDKGIKLRKIDSPYGFSQPILVNGNLIVLGERGTLMNFQLNY